MTIKLSATQAIIYKRLTDEPKNAVQLRASPETLRVLCQRQLAEEVDSQGNYSRQGGYFKKGPAQFW